MSPLVRISIFIAALTVLAAGLGGWMGVRLGLHQVQARVPLDLVIHREIHLSAEQDRQLTVLEAQFAELRGMHETEMRAANVDLAEAIGSEHAYGSKARQAVDRFHRAMSALQEDTIRHIFAMRAVMTADQAHRFDVLVAKALKPPAS